MNWNPIFFWLLVFTGVAVQASVERSAPPEAPRQIVFSSAAGSMQFRLEGVEIRQEGDVLFVHGTEVPVDNARECRVSVSGHARVELNGLTANVISLVADDHARVSIDHLVSTGVEASGTEFAKVELTDRHGSG